MVGTKKKQINACVKWPNIQEKYKLTKIHVNVKSDKSIEPHKHKHNTHKNTPSHTHTYTHTQMYQSQLIFWKMKKIHIYIVMI